MPDGHEGKPKTTSKLNYCSPNRLETKWTDLIDCLHNSASLTSNQKAEDEQRDSSRVRVECHSRQGFDHQ